MANVETVRGPVSLDRLGTTLMHEHVFIFNTEIFENYPAGWDEEERTGDAVTKLRDLKARGVDTIVDPTVIGLGRYIPRIERVNAEVDINIVVATGIYTYNDLPFYFHYRGPGTMLGGPEPMVEIFVKDITEGIAGTKVKAAFLKCVVEEAGLTPGVTRVLRAVAAAHKATGVPITVHTNVHHKTGLLAQKVLREEGADLGKVVIGHSGDSTDLAYLIELMEAGSILGMDRFGIDMLLPFEQRVQTVAELCKRGYAKQMVLSQDAACFSDWYPMDTVRAVAPRWNYTHIHEDVLPALRERGVTEEQITTMLVDNPREYFTHAG